jgi:catechol 2,3-dioxygenase-like lactoylglutathione lyase family enzyme
MSELTTIEVITLFARDIVEAKTFYRRVFGAETVYEDEVSCVLKFAGALVNLLDQSQAPELVQPAKVASAGTGASALFTIKVASVDLVCAQIKERGVSLLNGPVDRPWGRRTAAFADPSGHIWEVAQALR